MSEIRRDKNVAMNAPHEMIKCRICLKEVPATVAKTFDGPAYVHYFCGLDCLEEWQNQIKNGGSENRSDPL